MRYKQSCRVLVVFVLSFLLQSTESLAALPRTEHSRDYPFKIRQSRLLQLERTPASNEDREAQSIGTKALSASTPKRRGSQYVEEDFRSDPELPDWETDSGSEKGAQQRVGQPAAAPRSRLDTAAPAPAPEKDGVRANDDASALAQATPPAKAGVKRFTEEPVRAKSKAKNDSEGGSQNGGNNTQMNRTLNDTREDGLSAKKAATKSSVPEATEETEALEKSESTLGQPGAQETEFDDEEGQVTGFESPPKLSHRTSSWEGFGDISKKLTLVVVCSNVGGGTLEVKVVTPTWIRAEPESVRVGAGEERNVTLTVLDPNGLRGASAEIKIQSNGGDEFFEITKAALGRNEWYDGFASYSSLLAAGATIVGLAGLTYWVCRRRSQRHGVSSLKYKELEMQGDLSSALGQLPANNAGMNMSYSSGYGSGRSVQPADGEDESNQGWDDSWDDWDEEDQRPKRKA